MKKEPRIGRANRIIYSLFYLTKEERIWVAVIVLIIMLGSLIRWQNSKQSTFEKSQQSIEEKR